jgi:hypothetical protein
MSRHLIVMMLRGKTCLPMRPVSAVGNARYSVATAFGSSATQPQQQERVKEEQCEQEDGKNNQKARKSKKKKN